MTNRQTVSFIRNRFDEAGLRPVTRFGQNFLVDLNLLELLARSGEAVSYTHLTLPTTPNV